MTTTYTVTNRNSGTLIGRSLTAVEAAQEILGHDSHDYELRREDDTWCLFITRGSSASSGGHGGFVQAWAGRKHIYTHAPTEAEAWPHIALQVIKAGWESVPVEAMTDASYDAMMKEAEAE